MASRVSTKLFIPHPTEKECTIVGILEQHAPEQPTAGRKIALILHGTMGHKDYLFQKQLAYRIPMDSFRFDFRGNHETSGTWKQGDLDEDVVDLTTVVAYLKGKFGYEIDLVVGHSRGSVVAMYWLCTSEEGKHVSGCVNVSGRYRMRKIYDGEGKSWLSSIESQGYHEWKVTVARKAITAKIFREDLEKFSNWNSSIVWDRFPLQTDVLSIHGLADVTVPPYDAVIYARALGQRSPGTHNLYLVEEADHNFTGRKDQVVDAIIDWWETRRKGELTTGLWVPDIRGKL